MIFLIVLGTICSVELISAVAFLKYANLRLNVVV